MKKKNEAEMKKEPNRFKTIADAIASRFEIGQRVEWDRIRDMADLHTGGDLDMIQLDILTDMVERRIKID